jgi:hypothetical protein
MTQARLDLQKGTVLRKFALLASACSVLLLASFASAQQGDIMIGGSILTSLSRPSDLATFHQPIEKGGIYPSVSGDFVKFKHRLGINAEVAWRYKKGDYPFNGETYRPIFSDVNVLFQPNLTKSKKVGLDIFAGIGVASTIFYVPYATTCSLPTSGCITYTSSNHFLEDIGGGVRYYVWHRLPHVFIRPEAHYYHIQNNVEFNSPNIFRVGASVGYTFSK